MKPREWNLVLSLVDEKPEIFDWVKIIQRFRKRVQVRGKNECWNWTGSLNTPNGYGQVRIGRRLCVSTHRLSWEIANHKKVPENMLVRHTCDNRRCCNPAHLLIGTSMDNSQDAKNRGRMARGSRHWKRRRLRQFIEEQCNV